MSGGHGHDDEPPLVRAVDLAGRLPRLGAVAAAVAVIAVAAFFAWPALDHAHALALMSGPVSNHHRLVEKECARCHAPFRGTSDAQCIGCHHPADHDAGVAGIVAAHPSLGTRCADCHKEHHGLERLVPTDSPLCTGCHARLATLLPSTKQANLGDFAHHPEFSVRTSADATVGTRLDDPNLHDERPFKFSHAEHVAAVRKERKRDKVFTCDACHVTNVDGRTMRAMEFERDCHRCHKLEFDDRLKGVELPHGDAQRAFDIAVAEIARLHVDKGLGADAAKIDAEARDDEEGLFTEHQGCDKCHDVARVAPSPRRVRFAVALPRIPRVWMAAAKFAHRVHAVVRCVECHKAAETSTSASDVMMPGIALCRRCHADPGHAGMVESPCVECHVYHPKRTGTGSGSVAARD